MISIPHELEKVMNQLQCERLTSNEDNHALIQNVQNDKNPQLPKILKSIGWKDDKAEKCDYYIVKDADSDVLFFFAIRCGLVQDLYDPERIDACKGLLPLLKELFNPSTTENRKRELNALIAPVWQKYELSADLIQSAQDALNSKQEDYVVDPNKNTTRVWNTHPAIELAFFCQNSDCGCGRGEGD